MREKMMIQKNPQTKKTQGGLHHKATSSTNKTPNFFKKKVVPNLGELMKHKIDQIS